MSVESIAHVLHHSTAKGTDKLVLIGIANHDGDGGAWPSIATLATYANVSERQVQRSIKRLVELGEVQVLEQGGGTLDMRSDRRPNRYIITVPRRENGVTRTSPRTENGMTPEAERGDIRDANGVTRVSPEPSCEPSINHTLTSSSDLTSTTEAAWGEFWKAYPKQVGQRAARAAFYAAIERGAAPDEIVLGARRLAGDPNRPPMRFIPHPSNWLARDGWHDAPYPGEDEAPSTAPQHTRRLGLVMPTPPRTLADDPRREQQWMRAYVEAVEEGHAPGRHAYEHTCRTLGVDYDGDDLEGAVA